MEGEKGGETEVHMQNKWKNIIYIKILKVLKYSIYVWKYQTNKKANGQDSIDEEMWGHIFYL